MELRSSDFFIDGAIPNISPADFSVFRVRLFDLIGSLVQTKNTGPFMISVGYGVQGRSSAESGSSERNATHTSADLNNETRSSNLIQPIRPLWRFDQLVLANDTKELLLDCVAFTQVAPIVFDQWNLRSIEPNPSIAINFRGPPGTGKTMAAHAIADRLNRSIIMSRLSDLESKYHGEGPKNIVNLFRSASVQNAVLFIDEAESLLSRRFSQPDQAAESAINSMRTELLMALDSFDGLVIFATNLQGSYDTAISSRLTHVDFPLPNREARIEIWEKHLPSELPLDKDVDLSTLAAVDGVTGRDIKETVLRAAVAAARRGLPSLSGDLLMGYLRQRLASSHADSRTEITSVDLAATKAEIRARVAARNAVDGAS
ncbi:MAG: ATP-binding protein [Streptosporangiaceae bacterium]|nr:ATP-binding protein [Streptosporangiaceae bacterium]